METEGYSKNSRKSLAPMYMYDYLRGHKGDVSQKKLGEMLLKEHGISLGRSAIARDLHLLADEELCIRFNSNGSVRYDKSCFDDYCCDGWGEECDDEYDDECEDTERNDRNFLLPLFIREILKDNTSCFRHYSKQDLSRALDGYPYSIYVSPTALARYVHLLLDECPFLHRDEAGRIYYERVIERAA